jgi:hypothetical protein
MELCPVRVTVDAQSSMHPRQKSRPHPPGRRNSQGCDQPLIRADVVEQQLVTFVADFKPDPKLRDEILRRLADTNTSETKETARKRAALEERLRRLRDLYELGDFERTEYLIRREAIQGELVELAPQPLPDLSQAEHVLDDFSIFWRQEVDPEAKRQLLQLVFERVWLDHGRVVAVRPKSAFAPFFQRRESKTAAKAMCKERERRGSIREFTPHVIEIRL